MTILANRSAQHQDLGRRFLEPPPGLQGPFRVAVIAGIGLGAPDLDIAPRQPGRERELSGVFDKLQAQAAQLAGLGICRRRQPFQDLLVALRHERRRVRRQQGTQTQ